MFGKPMIDVEATAATRMIDVEETAATQMTTEALMRIFAAGWVEFVCCEVCGKTRNERSGHSSAGGSGVLHAQSTLILSCCWVSIHTLRYRREALS